MYLLFLFITLFCDTTCYEYDNNEVAVSNSWPMIVSIRYDCQHEDNPTTHCCSGTILSESYILTAAHCIDNLNNDNMTIAAGIHRQSESIEVIRKVDQIILHPNRTNYESGSKHNIALLHLSSPLDFTKDKHITRPYRPSRFNRLQYPSNSTRLLTIGWNSAKINFDDMMPNNLRQIEVSLLNDHDVICNRLVYDIEQQFCARDYRDNKGPCNHESGAPILQWIDHGWVQVGISTFFAEEANEGCLGIYTRLPYYLEWIESVLNFENNASTTIATTKIPMIYDCNIQKVSCGCSAENVKLTPGRIIGGEEAIPYSWSMIVSIRVNDSDQHSCGGSILTGYYILTAAHCVDQTSPTDISILAGIHNRIEDFPTIRYVQQVYIHPDWNRSDGTFRNDIALLRIFPPVSVDGNLYIARTCVPYINSLNEIVNYPPNGSHLAIIGWGLTQYDNISMSDTLQQASVYTIDNDDPICQQSIYDLEKQFCAGVYGGGNVNVFATSFVNIFSLDPCLGDSGGPILQWKGNYWEQVGITSYGGGCDHIGSTDIYTRLAYYFDWMESVINSSLTTTTPIPPPKPDSYACNKRSSCGCGKADVALTPSRVVGGEDAIEDSWPMIVSLRLDGTNDHSCGGTILSNSYILTAAHCFRRIPTQYPMGVTVAAGMTNLSDPSKVIRTVDRIYMHPNYSSLPYDHLHDIAILHIDRPFVFESNSSLTKTCIHQIDPSMPTNQYPKNGTRLAIIGWGVLRQGLMFLPEILQQVQVFAIDNQDSTCLNSIEDSEIQFCAGIFQGGKDSCQGDSGGPILQWTGQYWEQVGIVSYGKGCAEPEFPGVYTRLSYYYHWMEEILQSGGEHLEPNISLYETTLEPNSASTPGKHLNVTISNWSSTATINSSTATMTTSNSARKYECVALMVGIVVVLVILI